MSRREKFIKGWMSFLKEIDAQPRNAELYAETFTRLSDEEFTEMVRQIAAGTLILPVFEFNMSGSKMNDQKLMKIGEKLGIKWFQRLELTDSVTREANLTSVEFLVLELQVRRQIQHLVKKRSTASSNKVVDQLTGQVTGDSKSASISLPELTALNAKGNYNGILELIKVRGGDKLAHQAMVEQIRDTGGFSIEPILAANTRPKVVHTTNKFLRAMMLDSNL